MFALVGYVIRIQIDKQHTNTIQKYFWSNTYIYIYMYEYVYIYIHTYTNKIYVNAYIYIWILIFICLQCRHYLSNWTTWSWGIPHVFHFYRSSKNAGFNQQNRSRDNPFRLDIYVMYLKRGFPWKGNVKWFKPFIEPENKHIAQKWFGTQDYYTTILCCLVFLEWCDNYVAS